MKIIIKELPVEFVDRGWIKPLYSVEMKEPGKLLENQGVEGLEVKLVIKLIKKILKEKQKRRNIGEVKLAGYGEKPDTLRPKPALRPQKKCC